MLVDSAISRWEHVLGGVPDEIRTIVCGYRHMPFARQVDRRLVVNAGSVGMPYGAPGPSWALLTGSDVQLRRTAIDLDTGNRVTAESGYPDAAAWADEYIRSNCSDTEALAAFTPRGGLSGYRRAMFVRRRKHFGTPADKATYATLHTASLASPHLREGLTPVAAGRASKHLRDLLGTAAIAICDSSGVLAWDGVGGAYESNHRVDAKGIAAMTLRSGRTAVLGAHDVACGDPQCPIRTAVVAPIVTEDRVVAVLVAYSPRSSAALVRATEEVARWVSGQVELAELNKERTRAMEAELRALRAQISPHFIYNALAAIASFVRTDPARARELLLEFADFSRYALRRGGEFTTLSDELRNVERYLVLEQARFGERLTVSLLIAPEVLSVAIPFLVVQPLVENAVQHGLEGTTGIGQITIRAMDRGSEAEISVEDDGSGSDPEVIRAALSGQSSSDSVGLGNVDARLRQVYGDAYGLVVETAVEAGTKVSFRVPKYSSGVHASA